MPSRRNAHSNTGGGNVALMKARERKGRNRITRREALEHEAAEKGVSPEVLYLQHVQEWAEVGRKQRQQGQPRKLATSVASLPAYTSLPRALQYDGECPSCNHYPNHVKVINTSEGRKRGHECSECGTLMRPR